MATTIPIDSDTRDKLRALKVGDETYTDVIEQLLETHEWASVEVPELEERVQKLEEHITDE